MRMRNLRAGLVATLGVALLGATIQAQQAPAGAQPPKDSKSGGPRPDYGTTSETVINIPSYAFQGRSSGDQIADNGAYFRYFSAAGSNHFVAPVVGIPSGVVIDEIALNNCSAADGDIVFQLYLADWNNNLGGGVQIVGTGCTLAGCGADRVTGLGHEYDANLGGPLFAAVTWLSTNFDGSDRFNDFAISFHRITSPAPPTATFNDVPTSHPFFQFIEALNASGITAGCQASPPLYCPDAPLTRGQMAVFLAKALGLHWPN